MNNEQYIDHEVRLRTIEQAMNRIEERFDQVNENFKHLENKINTHVTWILGSFLAMMITIIATKFI